MTIECSIKKRKQSFIIFFGLRFETKNYSGFFFTETGDHAL